MKSPESIMKMLRQRHGLEEGDTSKDEFLQSLSPIDKLREVLGWEAGCARRAETLISWAQGCGFKISS